MVHKSRKTRVFSALTAGLMLAAGGLIVALPVSAASKDKKDKAEAPAEPQITKKVQALVNDAINAANAKQFDVVEAKLTEAEAEKKTPLDQFQIDEIRSYSYATQGIKFPELVVMYERSLQTPEFFQNDGAKTRVKHLVGATYNAQQYPKVIEYGNRWIADNPEDVSVLQLMGNAYYFLKDYKGAYTTMNKLVAISEKTQEPPKETWLRVALSAAGTLEDEPGIIASYEKILRYYPKPEDWAKYLSRMSFKERSDPVLLQWYRLYYDTGALARVDQYLEYSQLATDAAANGEAVRVLQQGLDSKILGTDTHKASLAAARKKADTDRSQLAAEEKQVQSSSAATGTLEAGLGLAYFSNEQYDLAIRSLDNGLKKGGLKNPDRYRIALGIAHLKKGNRDQARTAFQSVPADSPLAKPAAVWIVRTYN